MLGAERLLDVPHCFLDRDLGSITRLLEIRIDDVPPVSMSLMGLATSTGHTHPLPPSASPKAGFGFPTGAHPKRGDHACLVAAIDCGGACNPVPRKTLNFRLCA
jgi:hypothetical protein